jgi:hypothetical protein
VADIIPRPLPEHNGIHYCDPPVGYSIQRDRPYMEAFDQVYVQEDGSVWIGNGEYVSQVNFCPWCGKKAEKQL